MSQHTDSRIHRQLSRRDPLKSSALVARGCASVYLAAAGWGTLPAAFAGLLTDWVVQVTLKGAPASFADIAESEQYGWPVSAFLPGVLRQFDLPDCYRAMANKKLVLAP